MAKSECLTATPGQLDWMRHSYHLGVDRLRALGKMARPDMEPVEAARLKWLVGMQEYVLQRVNKPVPLSGAGLIVGHYMRDWADMVIAARADGRFSSPAFAAQARAMREQLKSELSALKEQS